MNGLAIAMTVNAVAGILFFEWSYGKFSRHRDGNEARDRDFPAFRRTDAYKWSRLKFWPGAMLFLPCRAIFCVVSLFLITMMCKLLIGCHDFSKGPLKNGCRRRMILFLLKLNAYIWVFVAGGTTS